MRKINDLINKFFQSKILKIISLIIFTLSLVLTGISIFCIMNLPFDDEMADVVKGLYVFQGIFLIVVLSIGLIMSMISGLILVLHFISKRFNVIYPILFIILILLCFKGVKEFQNHQTKMLTTNTENGMIQQCLYSDFS